MTASCNTTDIAIAITSQRLLKTPNLKTVCSSERALKALNHSKETIVQNAMVRASCRLMVACAQLKTKYMPTPISVARKQTRMSSPGKMRPTAEWRGGCLSSSPNLGSTPRGIAPVVS